MSKHTNLGCKFGYYFVCRWPWCLSDFHTPPDTCSLIRATKSETYVHRWVSVVIHADQPDRGTALYWTSLHLRLISDCTPKSSSPENSAQIGFIRHSICFAALGIRCSTVCPRRIWDKLLRKYYPSTRKLSCYISWELSSIRSVTCFVLVRGCFYTWCHTEHVKES